MKEINGDAGEFPSIPDNPLIPVSLRAGSTRAARANITMSATATFRSTERDLHHLVGAGAAWRRHLDAFADAFADKRAGERRGHREAALADIGFVFADDLVDHLLLRLLVFEGDGGTEFHHLAGKLRHVDHFGTGDLVLELEHASLDEALALARGQVLGILGKVAMVARLGDGADSGGTINAFEPLQLVLQPIEAG